MKFWSSRERQVAVDVTHLQMHSPLAAPASLGEQVRVLRADVPTVAFYRFLYERVGSAWQWYERLKMSDAELLRAVTEPGIEIDVLYVDGVPAGFVELDLRSRREVEIIYFGLMPEFIGRGFGGYFLSWALHRAWQQQPERVWLHTCSLDHPRALATYQKAGLQAYRHERVYIRDPRVEFPHLGGA